MTTLTVGDIAVSAIQGDVSPTKDFALVVLREEGIASGTKFFVTDNGVQWDATAGCGYDFVTSSGNFIENFYEYTAPSFLPFQTVISFLDDNSDFTLKEGNQIYTESGQPDAPNLERGASGGDQIIVYTAASYDATGSSSKTFIFAANVQEQWWTSTISSAVNNKAALPCGLTDGTNAVLADEDDDGMDNAYFTGDGASHSNGNFDAITCASKSACLALLADESK